MSEIQVSNARRVGFTALALVVFWVVAWRAYSIGVHRWLASLEPQFGRVRGLSSVRYYSSTGYWSWWVVLSLTSAPLIFLSFSSFNHPLKLSSRQTLVSGVLFFVSIGVSYWRGEYDAIDAANGPGPWPPELDPAEIMADLAQHGDTPHDLSMFRLARFQ